MCHPPRSHIRAAVEAYLAGTRMSGRPWPDCRPPSTVRTSRRTAQRCPAGLAHIEVADVSRQMLDRARDALTPVLGRCTLRLVHATADAYTHCPEAKQACLTGTWLPPEQYSATLPKACGSPTSSWTPTSTPRSRCAR